VLDTAFQWTWEFQATSNSDIAVGYSPHVGQLHLLHDGFFEPLRAALLPHMGFSAALQYMKGKAQEDDSVILRELAMNAAKNAEYDALRATFYHSLSLRIVEVSGLQVEAHPIEYSALEQTLDWENRRYQWSWFDLKRKFRNIPARFELSVIAQGKVCGLAIGKPSRGRRHLSVYFLEGHPDKLHPLKGQILPIILEAAALYAVALGCSYLRLIKPVDGLHARYQRHGFEFDKDNSGRIHCEQRLVRR